MSKFDDEIKRLTRVSIAESLKVIGVEMDKKLNEISDVAKGQFERLFPFILYCEEKGDGSVHSALKFREVFINSKPKEIGSFYGYDVQVLSPREVEFTVYGMRDNCRGGLGAVTGKFKAYVNAKTTEDAIEARIKTMASDRRRMELELMEAKIVRGYAEELRTLLKTSNVKAV